MIDADTRTYKEFAERLAGMTRPALHPDNRPATFEAIAEMLAAAAAYAENAARFADLRDPGGLAYATRCASACLLEAASLVEEVKPAPRDKIGGASA